MKKFDQINVIPFIDIMLVMLAIVLTTASFISQGYLDIKVPESSNSTVSNEQEKRISIAIDKDKLFFFQQKPVSLMALEKLMAELPNNTKIVLNIHENVAFQQFISILDLLKKNQLKNVSIITENLS